MDDVALRQFIEIIFYPALPVLVGGVIAILTLIVVLVRFHDMLPDKEILNGIENKSTGPQ